MINGVATVPTLGKIRAELFIIRRRATTFIKAEEEADLPVAAIEDVLENVAGDAADEADEGEGEAPPDSFKAKRAMLVTGPPPLGAAYDDESDEEDEAEAPVAEAPAAAAPGTYDDDEFDEA